MAKTFEVEYAGLDQASQLSSKASSDLISLLDNANKEITSLNSDDIFAGSVCDDAMNNWKTLLENNMKVIEVLNSVANYLDKTNANYADSDKLAEEIMTTSVITNIQMPSITALSSYSNVAISEQDLANVKAAIALGDNEKACWLFLKAKGLSDAAAAGVMGNIRAESSFKSDVNEHGNGIGYGLIQWSYGRRNNLEKAASKENVPAGDMLFQLEYLWNESLDPSTSYGKKLQNAGFYTTSSASDAAYYFHKYVEISADSQSRIQNNRCKPAENYKEKYTSL